MRVIAGSAKGTRLARPPAGTRPLSDRAREGLFSSLSREVSGARCADLFAGTGAVGIEALSRGAGSCLFVDSSSSAVRTIRENLRKTGLSDAARVMRADVGRTLAGARSQFDLAFLDPPYAFSHPALRALLRRLTSIMNPRGIMALTRSSKDSIDVIPIDWEVIKLLGYGDTRILILRKGT